jgi:cytochrome b
LIDQGSGDAIRIQVWDLVVRLFHWGLVLSFAVAWLSANSWEDLHTWAGYVAGGLILVRLAWGWVGTPYARFNQFVRSPRVVLSYLKAILAASEARYLGHNPAGGAMVVALMLMTGATALTGWLLTTDAFWGVRWAQHLHDFAANVLVGLIGLHIAGVGLASFRHRENLISAMISGMKRVPQVDDIE